MEPRPSLLWAGQYTDPNGYGEEARSFMVACERSGWPIAVEDWPAHKSQVEMTAEQKQVFAAARVRVPREPYINVWHKRPPITLKAVPYGRGPTVIRTMFETDSIPKEWLPALDRVAEIWVPSRFNEKTFARGGVSPQKLRVLPETMDFSLYDPERTTPLPLPPGARGFNFLSVFEFSSRKGWDALLDAWCMAFGTDEDVCLILKTSNHLTTSVAPEQQVDAYLAGRKCAPVLVETRTFSAADMPRLYAMCDAYVGASRGEAWGRPYMEAMAMGLPTIASRWGGNLDFTTNDNCFLVDGEVVEARSETDGLFRGQRWFEPSQDELAVLLCRVFQGGTKVEQRAASARPWLMDRFGERHVAERLAALSEDALSRWSRR